jgi:hypothetical protein
MIFFYTTIGLKSPLIHIWILHFYFPGITMENDGHNRKAKEDEAKAVAMAQKKYA